MKAKMLSMYLNSIMYHQAESQFANTIIYSFNFILKFKYLFIIN